MREARSRKNLRPTNLSRSSWSKTNRMRRSWSGGRIELTGADLAVHIAEDGEEAKTYLAGEEVHADWGRFPLLALIQPLVGSWNPPLGWTPGPEEMDRPGGAEPR